MSATKWMCKDCTKGNCCFSGTDRQIESCYLYKPLTNADLIRAMSDEELAAWLAKKFADLQAQQLFGESSTPTATELSALSHTWYCQWMYWLKQPAKDGDNK